MRIRSIFEQPGFEQQGFEQQGHAGKARAGKARLFSRDVLVATALTLAAAAFIGLAVASGTSRAPVAMGPSAGINSK